MDFALRQSTRGVLLTCFLLVYALGGTASAAVSDDEEIFRVGSLGTGAGQLDLSSGIASDPVTGHVFVVERGNSRISEFTPWGGFVKALGWDVAPGAVNEQQELRVRANTGQFKLSFGGDTTGDLAFSSSAAEVEAALVGLSSIGPGDTSVESNPGTASGTTPYVYVITFKGALAAANVEQLVAIDGSPALGGGIPATELEVRTRADGHAATTGLEACTLESGCKAGLEGGGPGQLARGRGLVSDALGNLYVREVGNLRVQKFDSAGRFLLAFGGEGIGPGQFAAGLSGGIALCSETLYVADKNRIQIFDLNGGYLGELPEPGKTVQRLACGSASDYLYGTFEPEPDVRRLDVSTGGEVGDPVPAQGAIATDPIGNLFAGAGGKVLEFDPSGEPLVPPSCCEEASFGLEDLEFNSGGTLYVTYAASTVDSFIRAFGPAPVSFESPPPAAPQTTAQFATSVQRDSATVAADINPNFFTDTTYFVQYGTGECKTGGCDKEAPVPPAELTKKAVKAPVKTPGVPINGLQPGTTYHYRFVAVSSGGGPVYGVDPDGEDPGEASPEEGAEGEFTTFPTATSLGPCANDLFRFGAASRLPNCRAYEMVSPVDKNNGDIKTLRDFSNFTTNLSQSAIDGNRFTYSSYRGFGDPKGAAYTNQYLAGRDPVTGWSSEALEPAQTSHFTSNSFENHYKAFTADLCQSWLMVAAEPVLTPSAAPEGFREVYRRPGGVGCGAVGYEALIQVEPSAESVFPILQGTSANGSAAVFTAHDALTAEAASGVWQVYHSSGGALHLVCRLPNGSPSPNNCSTGVGEMAGATSGYPQMERLANYTHAFSENGSRTYWTDSAGNETGPGKIYLRLNPGAEQSNSGCEEGKACTIEVSGTVNQQNARFLRASADGTKALFEIVAGGLAGNLYRFDAEAQSSTLVAGKSLGVAGASEDLSRAYFVSENALAGTSGATAGEPNLYLDEEGVKTFVVTLGGSDVGGGRVSNTNPQPVYHAARATPDGRVLAFISSESLTGYDNTDLASGKADTEVFLYEAGAGGPVCVSCNPSGARPVGRAVAFQQIDAAPTAAYLTLPENSLYTPRVISTDGRRLFFNSFDALLPRDSNGKADVYMWESASGQAACDQIGAELFVPRSGGCLSLISTGQSPQDSELLDTSANGNDAFFTTNASLLPRDPGLVDVYDARAGGGIAEPPPPPPLCQGETCQPVIAPPNDATPASSTYVGPEDQKPKKKAKAKKKKQGKKAKGKKKGKGKKGKGKAKRGHNSA